MHITNVHEKMKLFKCEKCDKSFSQSSNLKTHSEAVHFDGTMIKCDHCEKEFKMKSAMQICSQQVEAFQM